jgi:hypothetical protein
MNIQMDIFDMTPNDKSKREMQDKIEELATGKHLRGMRGKEMWEAHVKKMAELFGEE